MNQVPISYKLISRYFVDTTYYKKKEKCKNIKLITIKNYKKILGYNLTVKELNSIKKKYKIIGGKKKNELEFLIYNILRINYGIGIIKKSYQNYLLSKYKRLLNTGAYVNMEDFETLDSLDKINKLNKIGIYDKNDNKLYGFYIKSIEKLLIKYKLKAFNPYTRELFDDNDKNRIIEVVRLKKLLRIPDIYDILEEEKISPKKKLKFAIHDLIHDINNLGNYADSSWIEKLTKPQMLKYIHELKDIWEYRANLSNQTKFEIYRFGNPFHDIHVNILNNYSEDKLKNILIKIMNRLISNSNQNVASLGAFYILGTLTLVDTYVAECIPWLYQSFYYTNVT
tara:strand:- start:1251 stop:2267 length:1017 start_codon:yes stop_codon:yes gene_type:complete